MPNAAYAQRVRNKSSVEEANKQQKQFMISSSRTIDSPRAREMKNAAAKNEKQPPEHLRPHQFPDG